MNSRFMMLLPLALSLQLSWGRAWAGGVPSTPAALMLATQAALSLPTPSWIILAVPTPGEDSIRLKLKACLLTGDMSCVVAQWMALAGTSKLPDWLLLFQNAFAAANRKPGRCVEVAKAIHLGLSKLGQHPSFVRFTVRGDGELLGFIVDAYTGLAGLPEEEYLKRLISYPGSKLIMEVVEHL